MLLYAIIIAVLILFILLYTKKEGFSVTSTFLDVNPEHRYDSKDSIICNLLKEEECEQYGCRYDNQKKSCIRPDYCDKLRPEFTNKKNKDRFKRETGCGLPLNMRNYNPECLYYSGNQTECENVKPNGSCIYKDMDMCVFKNKKDSPCYSISSTANCRTNQNCVLKKIKVFGGKKQDICVSKKRVNVCDQIKNEKNCNDSNYCYFDTDKKCKTKKDPNKTYQTLFTTSTTN